MGLTMIGKSRRLRWQEWGLVLIICWTALGIRIHDIDDTSLWLDEAANWHRASQDVRLLLLGETPEDAAETPTAASALYPLLLSSMRIIAGQSETSLRLGGVWAGLLLVPLLFAIGARLFGRVAGFAAAALGALSPYGVWYSRAALPESLVSSLALLSVLLLIQMLTENRPRRAGGILWSLSTAGLFYIHQSTVWLLGLELLVIVLHVLRLRRHYELLAWALAPVLLALPLLPCAGQPGVEVGFRPAWLDVVQLPPTRLAAAVRFSSEAAEPQRVAPFLLIWLAVPTAVLLSASTLWAIRYPRRLGSWALTTGLVLAGILITVLTRFWSAETILLTVVPAALLLHGAGAAALWRRGRSLAIAAVIGACSVMVLGLHMVTAGQALGNGSFEEATDYVEERCEDGDAVVLPSTMTRFVWDYYYNGAAATVVISADQASPERETPAELTTMMERHSRTWLLHLSGSRSSQKPGVFQEFIDNRWVKFDEQNFTSSWLDVKLDGYMAEPPIVNTLPADAEQSELCWPTGLCLNGWRFEEVTLGSEAQPALFWSQSKATDYEYNLTLVLQDDEGQHWSECSSPLSPYYPASRWPIGAIVQLDCSLPLSPALPLTEYCLAVAVQRQSDEQYLVADTGKVFNSIGRLAPSRPAEPVKPEALQLDYTHEAVFDESLQFLGYNLPVDVPRPGHISFIDFYWQVIEAPKASYQQRTRLVARDGTVWVEKVGPLTLAGFGSAQWLSGDLVWGHIYFALPGHMPAGEYEVELSLIDPEGQTVPAEEIWRAGVAQSIVAGPAYVQNWPRVTEPPHVTHRPDIVFGGSMRLWGFEIEGEASPGGELDVTLVWYDEIPVDDDLHVFLHLMDEDGALVGQADGVPADWTRPTTTWRPGEYVVDQHKIPIASDFAGGVAYLWVGLYYPSGDGRVPVANALPDQPADRALLDSLVIEP